MNKRKCPELAQLLYAWLIDGPQTYRAGFDRFFLRRQRRCLAQHLPDIGYSSQDMPKWPGTDWYQWLHKWRQRYGVASRKPLSPAKLKLRHRILWNKVFRLRLLLKKSFGEDKPMLCFDQTPFWCNRAVADTTYSTVGDQPQMRELIAHGRRLFTITTCVNSAATIAPPVGVLYRRRNHSLPDWWPRLGSSRMITHVYRLLERTIPCGYSPQGLSPNGALALPSGTYLYEESPHRPP